MVNFKYVYISVGILLLCGALAVGFFFYKIAQVSKSEANQVQDIASVTEVQKQISNSFSTVKTKLTYAENDPNLESALRTFTEIAADETNVATQRVQALNGIYYAYTASNGNANLVADVVFSNPYFATLYVASSSVVADPVRPESGENVEAVETALKKLLAVSNALSPNHYALARMATAELFDYDRAVSRAPKADRAGITTEYAKRVESLNAAYDALPPLDTQTDYFPAMRIQVMYLHASALEFVGDALNNQQYLDRGDVLYQKIFSVGEAYPSGNNDARGVQNQILFARIFYAAHYWSHFKASNPTHIKEALLPLLNEENNKGLSAYEYYLPSRMSGKTGITSALRDIAKQMPELKAFLQGRGWKF